MYKIDWSKYLIETRQRISAKSNTNVVDLRYEFDKDVGKVAFCQAIRRMHDKTQVVPLTNGDTVLTRLTHSIEVMDIAANIVNNYTRSDGFKELYAAESHALADKMSAIVRAAALVHDIGNPPFGHFGEVTIREYFTDISKKYFFGLTDSQKLDFSSFDGNAQGFRILTKLQYSGTLDALNLTFGTLAAYLKYPNAGAPDSKYIGTKKHGVFWTESAIFDSIVDKCNMRLPDGKIKRHPLSFIVEAADTLCYNVMDMEDSYHQGWYGYNYIVKTLNGIIESKISKDLVERYKGPNGQFSLENFLNINLMCDDGCTAKTEDRQLIELRTKLIAHLVHVASSNFMNGLEEIENGTYPKELLEEDEMHVSEALNEFSLNYIINHKDVVKTEITGRSIIRGLLDLMIEMAFSENSRYQNKIKAIISGARLSELIHESTQNDKTWVNYDNKKLAEWNFNNTSSYYRLRMIVDFISGMTDKFAAECYQNLAGLI